MIDPKRCFLNVCSKAKSGLDVNDRKIERLTHLGEFKWFVQFLVDGVLKSIEIPKQHFRS